MQLYKNRLRKTLNHFTFNNFILTTIFIYFFFHFSSLQAIITEKDSTIKIVYVTNKSGILIKPSADTNSMSIDSLYYGKRIEVIQDSADWYGIHYYNQFGEFEKNRKVYVLKKHTGSMLELNVKQSELNLISVLSKNSNPNFLDSQQYLNEFIQIELITQQLFDSMKKNTVNYLTYDSSKISKKNGLLKLKFKNKTRKFKDKNTFHEDTKTYDFIGEYSFLKQYVIECGYYETSDFIFVDKTNGNTKQTFSYFPTVSTNKKHILSIGLNHFEMTGIIELHSIEGNNFKHVFTAAFPRWFPKNPFSIYEIFWSSDNCFYLPISNIYTSYSENNSSAENRQFIRIKIL